MFSKVKSCAVHGVDGRMIDVEADVNDGLPVFTMVGYLSSSVRESLDLWPTCPQVIPRCFKASILGDKAYGTNSIRTYITEQRASYTIPPKSNVIEPWFCDFHTYKERHLIECFFNKLKIFRRVATRYDKLAVSFLAFVHLASIWILLK